MRCLSLCVIFVCGVSSVQAQTGPIHAALASVRTDAAATPAQPPTATSRTPPRSKRALFWSGLALGVAGVTTSTLGLTVLRTEHTSTGNAPDLTYQNCVAQRDSDPIYATSQCGALKGKNLKLLWGGVAMGGAGAVAMIRGRETSAELSPSGVRLSHRWRF